MSFISDDPKLLRILEDVSVKSLPVVGDYVGPRLSIVFSDCGLVIASAVGEASSGLPHQNEYAVHCRVEREQFRVMLSCGNPLPVVPKIPLIFNFEINVNINPHTNVVEVNELFSF